MNIPAGAGGAFVFVFFFAAVSRCFCSGTVRAINGRPAARPCNPDHGSSVPEQVDDILGEESDNESEGRGKDKPGEDEERQQEEQEQPGPAETRHGGLGPQELGPDERAPEPPEESNSLGHEPR